MKARKLAKKVPNLIGDGVHNQPYDFVHGINDYFEI